MNHTLYAKYISWYSNLPDLGRSRLDDVCKSILSKVPQCLDVLNGETLWRRDSEQPESLLRFYEREAVHHVLSKPLTDSLELRTLFNYIILEIESGEIDIAELFFVPAPKIFDLKNLQWVEDAVVILSNLIYAAQIRSLIHEGIFEGTMRDRKPPENPSNEILNLLTRQVIQSVGGIYDCMNGNVFALHEYTFKGKHSPEQRNKIRLWLIEKRFIENISQDEFEYLFTVNTINEDMPKIIFREAASNARTLLRILVDDFEKEKNKINRSNLCITLKNGKKLTRNTQVAKEDIFKDMLKS
jgi:hypothetical protein